MEAPEWKSARASILLLQAIYGLQQHFFLKFECEMVFLVKFSHLTLKNPDPF